MSVTAAPGVRVGNEMANPMGWLMRRTKDVEELLAVPEVMGLAQQLISHLDNFCAVRQVEPGDLAVNVLRTPTLRYITLRLGTDGCRTCDGAGVLTGTFLECPDCAGTGFR